MAAVRASTAPTPTPTPIPILALLVSPLVLASLPTCAGEPEGPKTPGELLESVKETFENFNGNRLGGMNETIMLLAEWETTRVNAGNNEPEDVAEAEADVADEVDELESSISCLQLYQ